MGTFFGLKLVSTKRLQEATPIFQLRNKLN